MEEAFVCVIEAINLAVAAVLAIGRFEQHALDLCIRARIAFEYAYDILFVEPHRLCLEHRSKAGVPPIDPLETRVFSQ